MKKFIPIIILALLTNIILAQENEKLPYSTINFVRSGNFLGSGCVTNITLPNQREFNLSLSSIVKYKIYSTGEVSVTLNILCPATQHFPASSSSSQVIMDIKEDSVYYLYYSEGSLKQVEQSVIQKNIDKIKNVMKQEENLDFPINKSSLKNTTKKDGKGQGTCFLVSQEGYLITNYHCVESSKEITVRGIEADFTTKYGATLVASDPSNDLALIKINNKNIKFNVPPYSIRSFGVSQAEKVYALGFPKADAMGEEIKITEGIISAKSGVQGDISKFQISAAVNPGNSGGPLIDEDGNLIGVIYAKSTIADAAGYAIKASQLDAFLKNIENFNYPTLTNSIKKEPITKKVEILKDFIFIIETN
jgi:S1-C subfamily serine protease